MIRQVFAGLSPALVERLARLTGQTEAARARLAALAEEQQRARQVSESYASAMADLEARLNEHLVALGKMTELEALRAKLSREGWSEQLIADLYAMQQMEKRQDGCSGPEARNGRRRSHSVRRWSRRRRKQALPEGRGTVARGLPLQGDRLLRYSIPAR